MSEHLLLVSLGPVQDFIASARRCQDLWFGSWLLGSLARACAQDLRDEGGATLIFPGELRDDAAVANKVLALLPEGSKARSVAEGARAAMTRRLYEISGRSFAPIANDRMFHAKVAEQQLDDLMELVWVAVPMSADYDAARKRAETLLAERKNTRTWGKVAWDTSRPAAKSSLDGLRESVIDDALYDLLEGGGVESERIRRRFGIQPRERLCGIGLLKRLGSEMGEDVFDRRKPVFHSTSHLAAAPLLVRFAREPRLRADFASYTNKLGELGLDLDRFRIGAGGEKPEHASPFDVAGRSKWQTERRFPGELDGELLHEGRIDAAFAHASDHDEWRRKEAVEQARRALDELRREHRLRVPSYYALLMADGDHMGRCIDELAKGGLEAHRGLSWRLDAFVDEAGRLVRGYGGSLIYAGGDDVLALLPLHGALGAARALRDAFAEAGNDLKLLDGVPKPTLSVGLAVVHHMEPFGDARELARHAEKVAKGERDSLAIVVQRRSGGELEIASRWSEKLDDRILRWVRLLHDEALPAKAAFDLEEAVAPLTLGADPEARKRLGDVATSLAKRVLLAKRARSSTDDLADGLRRELETRFASAPDPIAEVTRLSTELRVAHAFLESFEAAFGGATRDETWTAGAVHP